MKALSRDVASAYIAAGARLASWIFVTALVYRRLGPEPFAILALVRTTIGLLNYAALGLGPATVRLLGEGKEEPRGVYASATALALVTGYAAGVGAALYAAFFTSLHVVPADMQGQALTEFVIFMGVGSVLRMMSEPFGAALQARDRITLDNILVAAAELIWLCMSFALLGQGLEGIGIAWFNSGSLLLCARFLFSIRAFGRGALSPRGIRLRIIGRLIGFGSLVAVAQAADFLYAPTDNILINRFINPLTVAVYAPAIQIDAGLLLLVGGLASVLLPRSAVAHGAGDMDKLRRYYIKGTLLSLAALLPAAIVVFVARNLILTYWLGDPMRATQAILPLVLIHTVVGGTSAPARSILLGMGKVKPFTAAVLIAGFGNVVLSYIFVKYGHWGLTGIVAGTLIAVIARCALWTPWYTLRATRH